jgi:hypothetical protein
VVSDASELLPDPSPDDSGSVVGPEVGFGTLNVPELPELPELHAARETA